MKITNYIGWFGENPYAGVLSNTIYVYKGQNKPAVPPIERCKRGGFGDYLRKGWHNSGGHDKKGRRRPDFCPGQNVDIQA